MLMLESLLKESENYIAAEDSSFLCAFASLRETCASEPL
jgi:hypothetical protein